MTELQLVLASESPRRRQLLGLLVNEFRAIATNSDESFDPTSEPAAIVEALARRKAIAGLAEASGCLVIGADSIVVSDGLVLNKPADESDARSMLRRLSGRNHDVFTGVALAGPDVGNIRSASSHAVVRFRTLSHRELDAYIDTNVWTDKAGAYGIQGDGGVVVDSVQGCYQTVVGFPLCLVGVLLMRSGICVKSDPVPCGLRTDAACPCWPVSGGR